MKTSAGLWPLIILVVVAIALLIDWNVNGGFGTLTRIVAWVGGVAFVGVLIRAIMNTNQRR